MIIKKINQKFADKLFKPEWKKFNKEVFGAKWESKHYSYGIYDKNELVGYIEFSIKGGMGKLRNILVKKRYRNRDCGNKLMEFFISCCKKQKCHKLSMNTNEKNRAAIGLYKKFGFKIGAVHKNDVAHLESYTFVKFI